MSERSILLMMQRCSSDDATTSPPSPKSIPIALAIPAITHPCVEQLNPLIVVGGPR